MKALVVVLLISSLVLVGCSSSVGESAGVVIEAEGNISATPVDYLTTEKLSVGFSPGKYHIGNLKAGRQADLPIILHNGAEETCNLVISYRTPDFVGEGYDVAPNEARDWLVITEPSLELRPKEQKETIITIDIPEGVKTPDKWEFWISIKDASQTGMVQTEGCVRVFVSTD